jgi:hypothetical protein
LLKWIGRSPVERAAAASFRFVVYAALRVDRNPQTVGRLKLNKMTQNASSYFARSVIRHPNLPEGQCPVHKI